MKQTLSILSEDVSTFWLSWFHSFFWPLKGLSLSLKGKSTALLALTETSKAELILRRAVLISELMSIPINYARNIRTARNAQITEYAKMSSLRDAQQAM
jgi:hypothetical protein